MSGVNSIFPTSSTASSATTSATTPSAANPLAGMNTGDFLKIMLSELQNQDPTQPTDPSALMSQLSSLETVQSQVTLQQQLQGLVSQSQLAQAGGLIGKLVSGLDANNNAIQGVVTSVTVQNGQATLNLDSGQALNMKNLTTIGTASTNTATSALSSLVSPALSTLLPALSTNNTTTTTTTPTPMPGSMVL